MSNTRKHSSYNGRVLPTFFGPSETEQHLVELCMAAGTIPDLAAWASAELAAELDRCGIDPGDLTLAQIAVMARGTKR